MRLFKQLLTLGIWVMIGVKGVWAQTFYNVRVGQAWVGDVLQGKVFLEKSQPLVLSGVGLKHPLATWFTVRATANLLDSLRNMGVVMYYEPNYSRTLYALTRDPDWSKQSYHTRIKTEAAQATTRGNPKVVIGIIDSGLDLGHPEFEGQVAINAPEDLNGNGRFDPEDLNGIDDDGNGLIDDVAGYDFTDQPERLGGGDYLNPDPDVTDDNGHGTVMAGIAVARAGNNQGGEGIAPRCKVLPIRAFSAGGIGEDDDIARAIVYAADQGVEVLNLSFGDSYPSQMMAAAIAYCAAQNVVIVAAAGNGSGDKRYYPAGFKEVIAVAATDTDGQTEFLWSASNFGTSIAISAPGTQIFAPTIRGLDKKPAYGVFSGTSAAAPMVAAGAALYRSYYPNSPRQTVRTALSAGADDLAPPGPDAFTGHGRLNLQQTLRLDFNATVCIHNPTQDAGIPSNTALPIIVTAQHPQFKTMHLAYTAGFQGKNTWITIPLLNPDRQVLSDTVALWNTNTLPDGDYTLKLTVELNNRKTLIHKVRLRKTSITPQTQLIQHHPIWNDNLRQYFIRFRANQPSLHRLVVKGLLGDFNKTFVFDKIAKQGAFLLKHTDLPADGQYQFWIESTNPTGITVRSPVDTFTFKGAALEAWGFRQLPYYLPAGENLTSVHRLATNRLHVITSPRLTNGLPGGVQTFAFVNNRFELVDQATEPPNLLPKSLLYGKLLGSYADSTYVFDPVKPLTLTHRTRLPGVFPAQWYDFDNDGQAEMIARNADGYAVYRWDGQRFELWQSLPDNSGLNTLGTAPRVAIADFDADGAVEVAFGNAGGALMVYELQANRFIQTFSRRFPEGRTSDLITAGDFDGNAIPDLFLATRTDKLRNDDNEYEPPFYTFYLLNAKSDNNFDIIWQDYVNNINSERLIDAVPFFSGSTSGGQALAVSTYPRTYIFQHKRTGFEATHFFFGGSTGKLIAANFNQRAGDELGIGVGDTTFFYELTNPNADQTRPLTLTVLVQNNAAHLTWPPLEQATQYRVFRKEAQNPALLSLALPFWMTVSTPSLQERNLINGRVYRYAVQAVNQRGEIIAISNVVDVQLGQALWVLNGTAIAAQPNITLTFERPPAQRWLVAEHFNVKGFEVTAVVGAGKRVVISLNRPLQPGPITLQLDSLITDDFGVRLANGSRILQLQVQVQPPKPLYVTRSAVLSSETAEISFSGRLDARSVADVRVSILPRGTLRAVSQVSDSTLRLSFFDVDFLGAGLPDTVRIYALTADDQTQILPQNGAVVILTPPRTDPYTYPNPAKAHSPVTFVNLNPGQPLLILDADGQLIRKINLPDNQTSFVWDKTDTLGNRIQPGVYLFFQTQTYYKFVLSE